MNNIALYESDQRRLRNKRKRQRQLQKNVTLFFTTIVLVLFFSITCGRIFAHAGTQDREQFFKYYTSIEVKYGETLWSIAEQYMNGHYPDIKSYIKEVQKINHLADESIRAGQYIIIPYFTNEFVGG
ncbi:MAG: LysM peptidoglycan-binding domain-containing protein [Lachnospiraceae bacterium]|nr:LysM peptidoglycan-binding domain-containing protein [Lachnospiraceae bacterium]